MVKIFDVFVMNPDGKKSLVTCFINEEDGIYNLTTWHMEKRGLQNIWDKKHSEKAKNDIYVGKNGKYCYVNEGDLTYFTLVDGAPIGSPLPTM